jgi:fructose-bisphosphate aldolase class II
MPHADLKSILHAARRKRYAVPNLWGGSVEKVVGHVKAAEQKRSPLLLCYNRSLCPDLPMEIGIPLIVSAAGSSTAPVATMLDHGESLEEALEALRLGLCAVMYDGSHLNYDENVRNTREVVEAAHSRGAAVEAELGAVGGTESPSGLPGEGPKGAPEERTRSAEMPAGASHPQSVFTDPLQAADFVEATGVDALAISFGNVHGVYHGEPRIELDRVRRIASLVDVPLVMHGASGLEEGEYGRIIDAGISKINWYSAMSRKAVAHLRTQLEEYPKEMGCHGLIAGGIAFYIEETARLFDLLGCSGRADDGIELFRAVNGQQKASP